MTAKKETLIRIDYLLFERWRQSKNIININERISQLIEADTILNDEDKTIMELEKKIRDQDNVLRKDYDTMAMLKMQLSKAIKEQEKADEEELEKRKAMLKAFKNSTYHIMSPNQMPPSYKVVGQDKTEKKQGDN